MEIEIKTFAPILIPTLNRHEHLQRCVESLLNCTHVDKTELIIGLDFPPEDKYVDGWKKTSEYINQIEGFKRVTVVRRDYNFGAVANYLDLIKFAGRTYDRFIFTEDDNIFSPNFLDYINKGLEKYKDDSRIFSICGYNYPMDMKGYEERYYFAHEISAWGWGCWIDKYTEVNKTISKPGFLFDVIRKQPFRRFLQNKMRLSNLIFHVGYELRGDVYMSCYQYILGKYSVFPTISLVRNCGHDGSGEHCNDAGKEDIFITQTIDHNILFDFQDDLRVEINDIVSSKLKNYFSSYGLIIKIYRIFLLMLIRTFVKIRDRHKL